MKHKKTKFIITVSLFIIALVLSIVPSYAHDGTIWYINFVDSTTNNQYTKEVTILEDSYNVYVLYDTTSGTIKIYTYSINQTINNKELVYEFLYTTGTTYSFDIFNDNDSEVIGTLGYGATSTTLQGVIGNYNDNVSCTITCSTLLYGETNYNLGVNHVEEYPELYNLYTEDEYNDNGTRNYNSGYAAGVEYASGQGTYTDGYNAGLEQGHEDSKTIIGIGNVILTGIYRAFVYFMGNTSIWGVALITIIVSAIVIFLVYMIVKLVRS